VAVRVLLIETALQPRPAGSSIQCAIYLLEWARPFHPRLWIVRVHISRMHPLLDFTLLDHGARDSLQTLG